ncbi:MAG: hypothetical protein BWY14_00978 [Parcubacteria group bacterium ADurb.Bin192]|nr:MAG: hypothetical protein BWY14_00978 [Parcubacteria group bacterium ADurb.Bin192]
MQNLKKYWLNKWLRVSSLSLASFLLVPAAKAQSIAAGLQTAAGTAGLPGGADADLGLMIGRIIGSLMGIIGSLLFLYMLYGGFRWMTAGGDAAAVTKAVSIIKNAIIGIMIIVFAYTLSNFVVTRLASVAGEPPAPPSGSGGGETCPYSCATQSDIEAAQDLGLVISCQSSSACPAGTQCCDFASP